MQNISDDELDMMFRTASEQEEFPFDQDAWEAMDSKLELASKLPTGSFKNSVISSAITVSIILLISIAYYNESSISVSDQGGEVLADLQNESNSNLDVVTAEESVLSGNETHFENDQSVLKGVRANTKNQNDKSIDHSLTRSANGSKLIVQSGQSEISNQSNGQITSNENVREVLESAGLSKGSSTAGRVSFQSEERADSISTSESNENVPDDLMETDADKTKTEEERVKRSRQLGVKLSIAPDFTSIGYGSTDRMGFNYGLLLDYSISERLLVSAGAILSRKIYSGKDVEYTFSSQKYTADKLTGDCRIIDLPINVYYFFKSNKTYSFFVSTGLTSYLMLKEDYSYTVKNGYSSNVYKQQIRGENNDWFKQLNISIGLQKNISDKVALQVEPFLKAPLAGVGEGKVSLASLGAFFSIRYGINFNRYEHE